MPSFISQIDTLQAAGSASSATDFMCSALGSDIVNMASIGTPCHAENGIGGYMLGVAALLFTLYIAAFAWNVGTRIIAAAKSGELEDKSGVWGPINAVIGLALACPTPAGFTLGSVLVIVAAVTGSGLAGTIHKQIPVAKTTMEISGNTIAARETMAVLLNLNGCFASKINRLDKQIAIEKTPIEANSQIGGAVAGEVTASTQAARDLLKKDITDKSIKYPECGELGMPLYLRPALKTADASMYDLAVKRVEATDAASAINDTETLDKITHDYEATAASSVAATVAATTLATPVTATNWMMFGASGGLALMANAKRAEVEAEQPTAAKTEPGFADKVINAWDTVTSAAGAVVSGVGALAEKMSVEGIKKTFNKELVSPVYLSVLHATNLHSLQSAGSNLQTGVVASTASWAAVNLLAGTIVGKAAGFDTLLSFANNYVQPLLWGALLLSILLTTGLSALPMLIWFAAIVMYFLHVLELIFAALIYPLSFALHTEAGLPEGGKKLAGNLLVSLLTPAILVMCFALSSGFVDASISLLSSLLSTFAGESLDIFAAIALLLAFCVAIMYISYKVHVFMLLQIPSSLRGIFGGEVGGVSGDIIAGISLNKGLPGGGAKVGGGTTPGATPGSTPGAKPAGTTPGATPAEKPGNNSGNAGADAAAKSPSSAPPAELPFQLNSASSKYVAPDSEYAPGAYGPVFEKNSASKR